MATSDESADDIKSRVLQTTLAEISSSRQDSTSTNLPDCCVICLDAISEPCAALPCAHSHFDVLCLLSWLQQQPSCPLCKANVYKVRYKDTQGDDIIYRVPNAARPRDKEQNREHPPAEYLRRRRRQRSPERDRGSPHPLLTRPADAIERRRHVYRHQLYSLHVGSNRHSQYRLPPTPVDFSTTPHLVSRARLWIRRELQVFSFLSSPDPAEAAESAEQPRSRQETNTSSRRRDNAEFLLEYIIAILKTVDMQGSAGQAEDMLSDFLGRANARLFLHELRNWLRSPAQSLIAWDREVKYDESRKPRIGGEDESEMPIERSHQRHDQREGESQSQSQSQRGHRDADYWRASRSDRKRRHEPSDDAGDRPRSRRRDE